jgi:hypothetical protein
MVSERLSCDGKASDVRTAVTEGDAKLEKTGGPEFAN